MVVKIAPPRGGGTAALFGLFSRASPQELQAKKEDLELTLRQKQHELRKIEHLLEELQRKAAVASALDQHILQQQKMLKDLEVQAEQRLTEFKRAESGFRSREDKVIQFEEGAKEQEALLQEKRRLLGEKEEALLQREDVVEERKARAEQLERALKHAESTVETRRNKLAEHIGKEEQRLREIRAARAELERELTHRRRENEKLAIQARSLAAAGNELEKARDLLQRKALQTNLREKNVNQREGTIAEQLRELAHAKRIVEQSSVIKQDAERAVSEKKRAVDEARTLIAENNTKLSEMREIEKRLIMLQHELDSHRKEIEEKLSEIDRKEKSVLKREMEWLDHQNALKASLEELQEERRNIETAVAERKAELATLSQEWDDKLASFPNDLTFIKTQKKEVDRLVKSDVAVLRDKEKEILGIIKEFDKDQKLLAKEERAVVMRIRQLERDQQLLERSKQELAAREAKIVQQEKTAAKILAAAEKAKHLKIDVPRLRSEAARLQHEVSRLESMARKYGATHIMREPMHAAHTVHLKRIAPARERPHSAHLSSERAESSSGRDELQQMIEGARRSIESGNVNEALRILDNLESAANRLSDADRKQISYEIKDLRTSIKLAML